MTASDIKLARKLRRDPLCMCAERAIHALRPDLVWQAMIAMSPDGRLILFIHSPPPSGDDKGVVHSVPIPEPLANAHRHWFLTGEMVPCDWEIEVNVDNKELDDAGTPTMGKG